MAPKESPPQSGVVATTTTTKPPSSSSSSSSKSHVDRRKIFTSKRMSSFELSFQDLAKKRTLLHKTWLLMVGVAAFLDFCGMMAIEYLASEHEVPEDVKKHPFDLRRNRIPHIEEKEPYLQVIDVVCRWFAAHTIEFAIVFSLMWATDAFVKAQEKRDDKLRDLDRKRIMEGKEAEELVGAWSTYYWTVLVELLLLPIGFYLVVGYFFRVPMNEHLAHKALKSENIEITFLNKDGSVDELHSFSTSTTQTLGYAFARYITTVATKITGLRVKAKVHALARIAARRVAFFSIRNPRKAARRFRQLRTGLRWFKYLAPLVATGNKLRGNVMDLIKKFKQRRAAKKAQRIRTKLWKTQKSTLPPKELEAKAATMIQSKYRARRARKMTRALHIFMGKKAELATLRVQSILRKKLANARANIMRKKQELHDLQNKEHALKASKTKLTVEERRRLYELQDELGTEAKELINKKLLLRPNTNFAVGWKILFVACVLFEISQLALSPVLKKYVDKKTGQRMDIGEIMELNFVPTPVTELLACEGISRATTTSSVLMEALEEEEEQVEKKTPRIARWVQKIRPGKDHHDDDHHDKHPRQDRRRARQHEEPKEFPWYCYEPIVTTQWFYIQALKLILSEFLVFVSIVCFLDVFVTFFTGELDPNNGTLIPKPFFTRWILPGMLLQLMVNPQMETVAKVASWLMHRILELGPIHVYRWGAALFFPLLSLAVFYIDHWLWRPFVKLENRRLNERRDKEKKKSQA